MKFRRKPVQSDIVEAVEVVDIVHGYNKSDDPDLPQWVKDAVASGKLDVYYEGIDVITSAGKMSGNRKDWLVLDSYGFMYPYEHELLFHGYEPMRD